MKTKSLLVLLTAAVCAFGLGRLGKLRITSNNNGTRDLSSAEYPVPGRELVMVYVGSSKCSACKSRELPQFISSAQRLLRDHAIDAGVKFTSIGVASELSPKLGIEHLNHISTFDELAAGLGVMNQANRHFVAVDHPGLQATPQVAVLLRESKANPMGSLDDRSVREILLTRKVGLQELENWVGSGARIPLGSAMSSFDSTQRR